MIAKIVAVAIIAIISIGALALPWCISENKKINEEAEHEGRNAGKGRKGNS